MSTQDKLAEALPDFRELKKKLGTPDETFDAWRDAAADKRWEHFDLSALRIGYELGKAVQAHAAEAELAALKARIAEAPTGVVRWVPILPMGEVLEARIDTDGTVPHEWDGAVVFLLPMVVEE